MKQQTLTTAIVLTRTNFGEADRIITVITPDHGKLRLMAKGVRKSTSKLAGGIELFSISELSFIPGKGDIGTLVSTRLQKNFGNIVKHIDRTMLGYELIKRFNKATEDAAESEYFDLLAATLEALNNPDAHTDLVETWFNAQLVKLAGNSPNLKTDSEGMKLDSESNYAFDPDAMIFVKTQQGSYGASVIKLMRLFFCLESSEPLLQIKGVNAALPAAKLLIGTMLGQFIRI
jgi:DNA repair protein RecO